MAFSARNINVAGFVLLAALSAAPSASAGFITDVIDFSATNFTTNVGSGSPPFSTITGEITVTLDPFYNSGPPDDCGYGSFQCSGAIASLTVDSLSVAHDFPVTATYGGESWGPDGLIFQAFQSPSNAAGNIFQVNIDGLSTGNLNFLGAGYGYYDPITGGTWYVTETVGTGTATLVSSTAAPDTPEPSTLFLAATTLFAVLVMRPRSKHNQAR